MAECQGTIYTVRKGDTLWEIAQKNNLTVEAILNANPQINDPAKLQIGQEICLPTATPGPPPPAQCPGQYYTVQAGDSLYKIAQRFGTTVDAILRVNPQITDPNRLQVGQIICIPVGPPGPTPPPPPAQCPGQYYTVQAGDSLYKIAQRFGTTVDAILRVNPQITDPNRLQVGQIICIPVGLPCPGQLYTIQAGDTLFSIAQKFNVTVDAIIAANPGIDPNNLRIGQVICIPTGIPECPGIIYTIQAGDTLYNLAIRYNTTVSCILRFNPGLDPNRLQIGQRICIPTGPCDIVGKRCQILMRTNSAPLADGFGIYDYDANTVSVLATGLPDPESLGGMVYRVFVRDKASQQWQAATMYITPDGVWAGIVRLPKAIELYDFVYVSAEQRDSTSPIGVIVLRGDISKA